MDCQGSAGFVPALTLSLSLISRLIWPYNTRCVATTLLYFDFSSIFLYSCIAVRWNGAQWFLSTCLNYFIGGYKYFTMEYVVLSTQATLRMHVTFKTFLVDSRCNFSNVSVVYYQTDTYSWEGHNRFQPHRRTLQTSVDRCVRDSSALLSSLDVDPNEPSTCLSSFYSEGFIWRGLFLL